MKIHHQRRIQRHRSLLLTVALLLPCVTVGLQTAAVCNTNTGNNQRPNQQLYFTSVAKSKCNVMPRSISSPSSSSTSSTSSASSSSVAYQRHSQHESTNYYYDTTKPLIVVPSQRPSSPEVLVPSAGLPILAALVEEETDHMIQDVAQGASPSLPAMVPRTSTRSIHSIPTQTTQPTSTLTSTSSCGSPSRDALVALGCVMAMNSGLLNGLGLSGALGSVGSISAVTGTFTNAAVAYSIHLSPAALGTVLITPFCYMLGSAWNGWWNHEETGNGMMTNMGSLTFAQTSPLILAGLLVTLAHGLFQWSTLSPNTSGMLSMMILPLLTMSVGMQNSWTSMLLQGNLLRTAHFSGMTSDFGTILGQVLHGNTVHAYKLPIYLQLLTSFTIGGMMSVLGTKYLSSIVTPSTCLMASSIVYVVMWTMLTQPIRRRVEQIPRHIVAMWNQQIQNHHTAWQWLQYWWKETHAIRHIRWQQQQQQQPKWGTNHA